MSTINSIGSNKPIEVAFGGTGRATLTAHDLIIGNDTTAVTLLAPSATSGVPLISQGAAADPVYGTALVAGGGTGAVTLTGVLTGNGTSAVTANAVTQHGVLLGGATNAVSSLGVAATGTVLAGVTSSDPAFTATPGVTSITFGAGSALSTFTDWTSWTPTITGGSTEGATTYVTQFGTYSRIGNIVTVQFQVGCSAATGTGNVVIGGLPFTISNTASYTPIGSVIVSGLTWPAGNTTIQLYGVLNTTTIQLLGAGSAVSIAFVQMANTTITLYGSLTYRV